MKKKTTIKEQLEYTVCHKEVGTAIKGGKIQVFCRGHSIKNLGQGTKKHKALFGNLDRATCVITKKFRYKGS